VHLLRDVEKYLRNSNTPAARFGREAVGDPRFVFDLRKGREPRPRTVQRIRAFLETGQ
jgi:2,4-dienoyl-CoA reductase-like NADH-dependent reductase (Old Yellow Enzyme family)